MALTVPEASLSREEAIRVKIPLRDAMLGDRAFYRTAAAVAMPMILQNTLSNVVSMLDNVMVGRIGALPMSAIAIVNQMIFVLYLVLFGALTGAGIYGTQFFGKQDLEGVRATMRVKFYIACTVAAAAVLLFLGFGSRLVQAYISAGTSASDAEATTRYALTYLRIMVVGFLPFGITQVYASTLREGGQTALPMAASILAMAVNFVLNLLLIFGLLGFPRMGVAGAALATVISRFCELAVLLVGTAVHRIDFPYLDGLFKTFRVPKTLLVPLLSKSMPLMVNEFLFSFGHAVLLQCYSVYGLHVIAAVNIAQTIANIFTQVYMSLGSVTGILTGQELGAGRLVSARTTAWRMASLAVSLSATIACLVFAVAPVFPRIYNVEPDIRSLAASMIRCLCIAMPLQAYVNTLYFILRSGGRIMITILFDSAFIWVFSVPAAFLLSRFTPLPVLAVYLTIQLLDLIKCAIGHLMVRSGIWVRNIVSSL